MVLQVYICLSYRCYAAARVISSIGPLSRLHLKLPCLLLNVSITISTLYQCFKSEEDDILWLRSNEDRMLEMHKN